MLRNEAWGNAVGKAGKRPSWGLDQEVGGNISDLGRVAETRLVGRFREAGVATPDD